MTIMGQNGAGKSSIIKMLNGMLLVSTTAHLTVCLVLSCLVMLET